VYRGAWKALDNQGEQFDLVFDEKNFKVKHIISGESKDFSYTQNSIKINNGVKTYGIKLNDGKKYLIHFPMSSTENKAVILTDNGGIVYTLGRGEFVTQQDIYQPK